MTDLIEIPIVVKDKGLKQSITSVSQLEKRIIAASKAVDAGSMSQDRYNKILLQSKRDYQTLGVSSQKATYEVRRFAQAQKEAAAAARLSQTATQTLSGSKVRYAAAARSASDVTSRLRQSFLSTANSVAILDGPLGGIASRFSAFGVLIGRTGLLLGGFMVGLSALGVFVNKGIRSFMAFEVATAKIGAILRATGKDVEFAGAEIERMVSGIAMSTLESEQSVRAAATQLLTFRNIGKEVFEDVLKSASDMAAAGFGTVESEAVKLAKALEDPRQSLTSLSRSGITFTRQQRQLIISLVESGRQAEAMAKILETVNGQVGGAGEAAARDTMAGSFDTIGQAVGLATRQLGQFVAEATGLEGLLSRLASRAAEYVQSSSADPRLSRIGQLRQEIEALERLEVVESRLGMAALNRGQTTQRSLDLRLNPLKEELQVLERQLEVENQLRASAQATAQVQGRISSVENIREEIELRMEAVALSDVEIRAQRALASQGLFRVDAAREMESYIQKMREAGKSVEEITDGTREFARVLVEVDNLYNELVDSFNREAQGRAFLRNLETLEDQNELLTLQLGFMDQGLDASEARRNAEYQLQTALAETLLLEGKITQEKRDQLLAAIALNSELSADLGTRTATTRGGGRAPVSMRDSVNQRLEQISQERELLGLYGRQQRTQAILFDLQKQNKEADIKLTDGQLRAAAQQIEQEENLNNLIRERRELQENLAKTLESSMETAFMSMVDGTKSVRDAFRDMARQIIAELYRVLVVQRMVGTVGGSGIAGALGGLFGGNRASGGTMLSDRPYLVGERGPELVIPGRSSTIMNADLTRKATSGEGSVVVNNNITVTGGSDPAAIRQEVAKLMPQITNATKSAVIDARRRGGQMRAAFN